MQSDPAPGPVAVFHPKSGTVRDVAFLSTDEATPLVLSAGGGDCAIRCWHIHREAEPLTTLSGHDGVVFSVAPCGPQRLLSASADGTSLLWDLRTTSPAQTLAACASGEAHSVHPSPSGNGGCGCRVGAWRSAVCRDVGCLHVGCEQRRGCCRLRGRPGSRLGSSHEQSARDGTFACVGAPGFMFPHYCVVRGRHRTPPTLPTAVQCTTRLTDRPFLLVRAAVCGCVWLCVAVCGCVCVCVRVCVRARTRVSCAIARVAKLACAQRRSMARLRCCRKVTHTVLACTLWRCSTTTPTVCCRLGGTRSPRPSSRRVLTSRCSFGA